MFFAPSKSRQRAKVQNMDVPKTSDHIKIKINMPNTSQEPPASPKAPWIFFAPSKSRQRAKIRNLGVSKNSDHIKIKIKIANPRNEHPASSKALNQDFKDTVVLCILKTRQKAKIQNRGLPKTTDYIQVNIKMPNANQEPPGSSEATNQDLKDIDTREYVF